jgi:hypothetical protein
LLLKIWSSDFIRKSMRSCNASMRKSIMSMKRSAADVRNRDMKKGAIEMKNF